MRYDVNVTTLSDLQDGDEFEVGSERWALRSGCVEIEGVDGPWYGISLARDLIRALGKVSRPIPITPAKTEDEAREIPAIGVECEVLDVGCLYHPTIVLPAEFKPGDRVRVVRVQKEVKKG